MFVPSGSGSFSLSSVSAALGQVFYSLSLCMGITVTYGSYLNKKENIRRSCANVAALDTSVALLAGIAIFPAVFSFGLEVGQGPQLIFETLPRVFAEIPLGVLFAAVFSFWSFSPLYSAIAAVGGCGLLCDRKLGLEPQKACCSSPGPSSCWASPSALSFGPLSGIKLAGYTFFDLVGVLTDNFILPLGGILMCYFIGWKWDPDILAREIEADGTRFRLKKAWILCIRFLTPILILIVTVTGLINLYQSIAG